MYKFKVVLGDWSHDGHNQSDDIIVECSHDVETMQNAYKASCEKFDISFDNKTKKTYRICTDYEDNTISSTVIKILQEAGCPIQDFVQDEIKIDKHATFDDNGFVKLLMWFMGQSVEGEFKWEFVTDEIPVLNGYWNKNLNVAFGYGLYR